MRVLIPVDGSKASDLAVSAAVALENNVNLEVTLLNVITSSSWYRTNARYRVIEQATKPLELEGQTILSKMRKCFPQDKLVKLALLEGEPAESVVQFAEDSNCDMIMMGSQGIGSTLRSVFIGSVTKHVLAHVEKPVLVMGKEGWKKTMKNILIPVDGSKTALNAVDEGVKLQKLLDADVTLLYVVADPRKEGLVEGTETMLREESVMIEKGEAALAEAKGRFPEGTPVKTMILKGVVTRTIENVVVDNDFDLIIMGTQGMGSALKRLILGSVTKHVLQHVAIPILVVR